MDNVKIIGSRRAYDFAPDEIRLSSLTLPSVVDRIRQALQFQNVAVGTPVATFGPIPQTAPPGLTFSLGRVESPPGTEVLIRAVNFEPGRLVVDAAGFSAAIDVVYQTMRASLAGLKSGDGSPILGEPTRALDQSTITARLSFSPADLLPPSLRSVFETAMGIDPRGLSTVLVPTILVQNSRKEREYPGFTETSTDVFQFAPRAGVSPDDQVYFSVAPLDTDRHLRYLQELESALTGARA